MPNKITCLVIVFFVACSVAFTGNAQTMKQPDGSYALPENVVPGPDHSAGFPRSDESKLFKHFKNPPRGHGQVPFNWWTGGDTLNKERLLWQLNKLNETAIDGSTVCNNHTHRLADTEFVDAENFDFRLKSRFVARKIGFEPFDYEKAGVYGSEEWKKLAVMDSVRIALFDKIENEKRKMI